MAELRPYQQDAVAALLAWFEAHAEGHPLIVAPTGSGKSILLAEFIRYALEWPDQRILVVTHVRELIAQNHAALLRHWPEAPAGVFSAGLGSYDTMAPVVFCGIQSVHRRAELFGRVDLVLIDEAHLVPKDGQGMYRRFIESLAERNPAVRVIGFTATPFRLQGGYLHKGDGRIFTDVAYDIEIDRLVDGGFLAPLVSKRTLGEIDVSAVHVRGGEFVAGELEAAATVPEVVRTAVDEAVARGVDRRSWLVFCVSVAHAEMVLEHLRRRCVAAELVTGETPTEERDRITAAYKSGELRALVNVNVLTTGFDAPATDLLVVLRPTASPVLYVQMMGRGMRIAEGKTNCLVLDFGGNVMRHGPINCVRPREQKGGVAPCKVCPRCESIVPAGVAACPDCGHAFPAPERQESKHDRKASNADVMAKGGVVTCDVDDIAYSRHQKAGGRPSLRVTYHCAWKTYSKWICIEHDGFALRKAWQWWRQHDGGQDPPPTVDQALALTHRLRRPSAIKVKVAGEYPEVVGYEWERTSGHDGEQPNAASDGVAGAIPARA